MYHKFQGHYLKDIKSLDKYVKEKHFIKTKINNTSRYIFKPSKEYPTSFKCFLCKSSFKGRYQCFVYHLAAKHYRDLKIVRLFGVDEINKKKNCEDRTKNVIYVKLVDGEYIFSEDVQECPECKKSISNRLSDDHVKRCTEAGNTYWITSLVNGKLINEYGGSSIYVFRCFLKPFVSYLNEKYLNNKYGSFSWCLRIRNLVKSKNLHIAKIVNNVRSSLARGTEYYLNEINQYVGINSHLDNKKYKDETNKEIVEDLIKNAKFHLVTDGLLESIYKILIISYPEFLEKINNFESFCREDRDETIFVKFCDYINGWFIRFESSKSSGIFSNKSFDEQLIIIINYSKYFIKSTK